MSRKWARKRLPVLGLLLGCIAICSCGSSIALFDQHSYENATNLKAETLALMGAATDAYTTHEGEVRVLLVKVDAAREYAAGLPKNQLSTRQWELLAGPNLIGGFFALWKEKSTLLSGDVDANRKNVQIAFDEIIRLESQKIK